MSITKIQTGGIPALAVTHDKLHTDMDLSTKTVTLPTLSTLNTTGNVLVGTVDTNVANNSGSGNDGVNIHPDSIRIARTDSDTLLLNRLNSDGDIIKFLKDGAAVGIVGTVGSDLTIGTGDVALRFQDGSDNLVPHNISTNSTRDGGINIGTTGARFKALHLSGTVNAVQLDITAGTDAKMYTSNAISEVGTGTFAMQSVNSAGSALRPLGFRASDIRFATGSSERMRIDNDGNVGIGGTAVPSSTSYNSATLHLRQAGSSSVGSQLRFTSGNSGHTNTDGGFISYWADNNFYLNNQETGDFRFYSGGSERTRVRSNGSFEIGYAGAALQQADSQAMTITTPASGGGKGIALKRLDSNSDQQLGEITWSNNTQDGQASIRVKTEGAVNTTDMHFDVNNAGSAANSALIIAGKGGGTVGVGRTPVNGMQFTVAQQSSLGGVVIGQVLGSINNNSEALLLHRLDGNTVGFQFSGEIYCNSWTGQAHVNFNATSRYTDDHVTWFKNSNGAGGGISKVQLRLATISYASGSYIAVIKDGGGTGVFYINGFLGSNMDSNGGVRAVAAGQYTVTTTHVNLN